MIPYGRQDIDADDIEAVVRVLRSDFLTQGPVVPAFERAVAARVHAAHAVACNSATAALHLACLALGVGPGDRVWTSPITFVASANCARYCGAQVDFVDIDESSWNLCPDRLEEKLRAAERAGRLPRVVIPVHLCGLPCEMERIAALAQRYGFRVIEDASHAIGASAAGEPVGSGRYSDITVFSFHPVKLITTGEGGMALTRDAHLAARMALLRSHGITREPAQMQAPQPAAYYYEQLELGYNYRLTDLQAALGLSQLQRLDGFLARRQRLAERYHEALAGLPLQRPSVPSGVRSAWHLYVVRLLGEARRPERDALYARLRAAGIGANLHYLAVHLQPYYRQQGFKPGDFPQAERHADIALTLPLYPGLDDAAQARVVEALATALQG